MAYIPKKHQKYGVLPYSSLRRREVFCYPSDLINEIGNKIGEQLIPYGFRSYRHYNEYLRDMEIKHPSCAEDIHLLRKEIADLNNKEAWSVLRYIGPDIGDALGLQQNHTYYWPCSFTKPVYMGVIDDEEFTDYMYPTDSELWEILEDPTGMAYRTLYENGENQVSSEDYSHIMQQLNEGNVTILDVETLGNVPEEQAEILDNAFRK